MLATRQPLPPTHASRSLQPAIARPCGVVAAPARPGVVTHRCAEAPLPQHGRSRSRARSVACRAELGGMLDTVVTWGTLGLSAGATAYALFHAWPAGTREQPGCLRSDEDNFAWALMSGVSCLPLFNSMAWVLGALQGDSPRAFSWAAALYALPLLRNGLEQDWWSLSLLLLGAVHMQALRIGATEPELQAKLQAQLRPLAAASTLAAAAGSAANAALGAGSSSSSKQLGPGGRMRPASELQRQQGEALLVGRDGADDEAAARAQELLEFDRRLQQLSERRHKDA